MSGKNVNASISLDEKISIYSMLISEQKSSLNDIYDGMVASKKYIQQIFAASSFLIALISVLQIFNKDVELNNHPFYLVGIFVVAILYIAQIALCIIVMMPVKALGPVGSDWDKLFPSYVKEKTEIDAMRQLLADYLGCIKANEPIMIKRGRLARITGYLFPIIVLLLFVLSFINRLPAL